MDIIKLLKAFGIVIGITAIAVGYVYGIILLTSYSPLIPVILVLLAMIGVFVYLMYKSL